MEETMINNFEARYFYIKSPNDEKFIRWSTVKGNLNEDILDDYDIISDLMAMDVRDKFGEEYDVWEITKEDFDSKVKPKIE
jgi:hypothetical protein